MFSVCDMTSYSILSNACMQEITGSLCLNMDHILLVAGDPEFRERNKSVGEGGGGSLRGCSH